MQIRAELCHVDTLRCIVRVEAWDEGAVQGSALGEAANAEEAEERALERLNTRLQLSRGQRSEQVASSIELKESPKEPQRAPVERPRKLEQDHAVSPAPPATQQIAESDDVPSETPTDPDDWSDELTAIDLEIRRIGWTREQEQAYLNRAFGLGSRHKLTRYADLVAYLRQLRQLQPQEQPDQAHIPIRRSDLITQGDQMLKQLGWKAEQARAFLQEHLQASSRQQLTDEQLLQFNMLLEEQAIAKS